METALFSGRAVTKRIFRGFFLFLNPRYVWPAYGFWLCLVSYWFVTVCGTPDSVMPCFSGATDLMVLVLDFFGIVTGLLCLWNLFRKRFSLSFVHALHLVLMVMLGPVVLFLTRWLAYWLVSEGLLGGGA